MDYCTIVKEKFVVTSPLPLTNIVINVIRMLKKINFGNDLKFIDDKFNQDYNILNLP